MKSKGRTNRHGIFGVKFVCFLLTLAATTGLTLSCFGVLECKRNGNDSFHDVVFFGANFDVEKSETLKTQAEILADNIMQYAVTYQSLENFDPYALIISSIEECKERYNRMCESDQYSAEYQIENDCVSADFVENGFIRLSDVDGVLPSVTYNGQKYGARVNAGRINSYYNKKIKKETESIKMTDSGYKSTVEFLNELSGVRFAVIKGTQKPVSNMKNVTAENISSRLSGRYLFISDTGKQEFKQSGLPKRFVSAIRNVAASYGDGITVYISFGNSLLFNENCRQIESEYAVFRRTMTTRVILATVFFSLTAVLLCVQAYLSGKQSFRGITQTTRFDKIPFLVSAVLLAAILVISAGLLLNSLQLFMNPTLSTTYLTLSTQTIVTFGCIHACIFVSAFSALICRIKRTAASKGEPNEKSEQG